MPEFGNLLIVVAVAFAAPFILGLFPKVRLPSVVVEIIAGIVVGPAVLGWVEVDEAIEVVSIIGLAFLLENMRPSVQLVAEPEDSVPIEPRRRASLR